MVVTECVCCMSLMLMIDTRRCAWSKHMVSVCGYYLWLMLLLDLHAWCSRLVFVLGTCFVRMVVTRGWCSWLIFRVGCTWWVLGVDTYAWRSRLVLMAGVCCASWLVSIVVTYSCTPPQPRVPQSHWLLTICLLWTCFGLQCLCIPMSLYFFLKASAIFFPLNLDIIRNVCFST